LSESARTEMPGCKKNTGQPTVGSVRIIVSMGSGGKRDMEQRKHEKGRIRFMIADDHTILRQGLAAVLAEEPDFEFVGFAEDGQQTLERYAALNPSFSLRKSG
jgi:hypothetical protein